jgi:protein gp37
MLDLPLRWKKPQNIFVNSMSDLFHEDVPDEFIIGVFKVMHQASWHRFQVLTKRSSRLSKLSSKLKWLPNIWMGVSIENSDYLYRIEELKETSACVKFLSIEPLLGPIPDLNLTGIDWVIVGGESGPGAKLPSIDWIREIKDQCIYAKVPFFFKQWGGPNKKKTGRLLEGRLWEEMPRQSQMELLHLDPKNLTNLSALL